jgi:hypothetical protein
MGPEKGGVHPFPDVEGQVVEDSPAAPDHRRVMKGEQGRH